MARSRVKVWEDQITIPTYPLHPDDVNPRFFELEGTLIYPYTMQDHLSRTKVDRAYQARDLGSGSRQPRGRRVCGPRLISIGKICYLNIQNKYFEL